MSRYCQALGVSTVTKAADCQPSSLDDGTMPRLLIIGTVRRVAQYEHLIDSITVRGEGRCGDAIVSPNTLDSRIEISSWCDAGVHHFHLRGLVSAFHLFKTHLKCLSVYAKRFFQLLWMTAIEDPHDPLRGTARISHRQSPIPGNHELEKRSKRSVYNESRMDGLHISSQGTFSKAVERWGCRCNWSPSTFAFSTRSILTLEMKVTTSFAAVVFLQLAVLPCFARLSRRLSPPALIPSPKGFDSFNGTLCVPLSPFLLPLVENIKD